MNKSIKVAWFPKEASRGNVLSSNGKSLDKYCIKCVTDEKLSGDYPVDLTFINTDNIHKLLYEGAVLKLKLDYGFEVFDISKVTSDLKYVDVVARQHTIQSTLDLYLDDVRPTELTGQSYLQYLLNNSQGIKDIFISSDIAASATGYYQDMSLYKALHDCEQSFYNKLGGEIQRRGYNLTINRHIGIENTGITIRERKNLLGLEIESDIDNLVTIARGKGYNGITGHWIESPNKNKFKHIHKNTIEFSDVKVKSESDDEGYNTLEEAIAELDRRIRREFNKNHIDTLKTTYRLSYIELEKTSLYRDYAPTERAFIGDTIRVYVPRLDTDIKVRVIERKYDVLKQKVIESILSNYYVPQKTMSIDSIISDLKKEYSSTYAFGISSYIAAIIKAGMQDSYVVVRDNEILVMDTKDINTAKNVWRWNKGALAHSSEGYYTTNWNVGITQDGKINASMILTGILKAITLESMDGGILIDLGIKGRMSINSSALDINLDDNTMDNVVRVCWNNYSKYVQLEPGQLVIYNGTVSESEKRMALDEDGLHFWRDGYYAGKIGINNIKDHVDMKGFTFDLEYSGAYMCWAIKETASSDVYSMIWTYANKDWGNGYEAGKLHAGCNIDMHNWGIDNLGLTKMSNDLDMNNYTIKNAHMENGITGTLNFVQVKQINTDGTVQTWTNNCLMKFEHGILVGGTWNG